MISTSPNSKKKSSSQFPPKTWDLPDLLEPMELQAQLEQTQPSQVPPDPRVIKEIQDLLAQLELTPLFPDPLDPKVIREIQDLLVLLVLIQLSQDPLDLKATQDLQDRLERMEYQDPKEIQDLQEQMVR